MSKVILVQRKFLDGWITAAIYENLETLMSAQKGFNISDNDIRIAECEMNGSVNNPKIIEKDALSQASNKNFKEAYDILNTLPKEVRNNLRGVFPLNITFEDFVKIITGKWGWGSVGCFLEQAKRAIVNETFDNETIKKLEKIFVLLCKSGFPFKDGWKSIQPTLIIPKIGERYNSEEQLIIGNKSDGIIDKILLVGYKRGDQTKHALVSVRDR